MNENEIWKDIEGYEGLYQVSNLGRVKSLRDNKGKIREKIIKQYFCKNYLIVNICKNGKMKTFYVHRLVAQAFITNPNNLPQVNHIDENPSNNCVDNLEWCTQKYNLNYGSRIAKAVASTDYKARTAKMDYKAIAAKIDYKAISEKQRNDPNKSKQVYQYNKKGELVAIWQSTKECSRNGYDSTGVSKCCLGKLKSYKNFIWSYEEIKKGEY